MALVLTQMKLTGFPTYEIVCYHLRCVTVPLSYCPTSACLLSIDTKSRFQIPNISHSSYLQYRLYWCFYMLDDCAMLSNHGNPLMSSHVMDNKRDLPHTKPRQLVGSPASWSGGVSAVAVALRRLTEVYNVWKTWVRSCRETGLAEDGVSDNIRQYTR